MNDNQSKPKENSATGQKKSETLNAVTNEILMKWIPVEGNVLEKNVPFFFCVNNNQLLLAH